MRARGQKVGSTGNVLTFSENFERKSLTEATATKQIQLSEQKWRDVNHAHKIKCLYMMNRLNDVNIGVMYGIHFCRIL